MAFKDRSSPYTLLFFERGTHIRLFKQGFDNETSLHCIALWSSYNQTLYLSFCERQIEGADRISVREFPKVYFFG